MKKIPQGRSAYVCLLMFVVFLGARASAADSLALTWDFNSEPEVEGYRVYVGTESGVYSQTVDVLNTNTYRFSNATPGQRYCFAVLAYAGALVSPLSQEVCGTTNDYPTFSSPGNQSGRVGIGVSLQLSASDPDGTPLTYSASGLPAGLTILPGSGTITGTPTAPGTFSVTARATDGVLTAQQSFTWVIQPPLQNVAPTLVNPGNQTGDVGRQVLLQLQGADANGDALTYSALGLPAGLQVSSVTGLISGTPITAASYSVTVRVSDGRTTVSQLFAWGIRPPTPVNIAPTLASPGSQSSVTGQSISLQLQGGDANGDALTYSAMGLPPGLQVFGATGQISGTPTVIGTYNVTAAVSDGRLSTSTTFVWTVSVIPGAGETSADGSTAAIRGRKKAPPEAQYKGQAVVRNSDQTVRASTRSLTGTEANLRPAVEPIREQGNPDREYTGTSATGRQPVVTSGLTNPRAVSTRAIVRETIAAAPGNEDAANLDVLEVLNRPTTSMTGTSPRAAVTAPAAAPRVTIDTPINRDSFAGGSVVIFMGTARDALDVDLTETIVWTSSRDGRIGTGGLLHKALTAGTHVITASVTDSRGSRRSAQVTVIVSK